MKHLGWYGEQPYDIRSTPDIDIQYSIAFPWGDWHVSTAAHNATGLTPLAPVEDGFVARQADNAYRLPTRVYLVKAGEFGTPEVTSGQTAIMPVSSRYGTAVRVALGDTSTDIAKWYMGQAVEAVKAEDNIDLPEDEIRDSLHSMTGEPLEEALGLEAPQLIMHHFTNVLVDALPGILLKNEIEEQNRAKFALVRNTGLAALTGVGLCTLAGIFEQNYYAGIGSFIVAAAGTARQVSQLRSTYHLEAELIPALAEQTESRSITIAEEIHNIYCRRHFERKMGDQLGEIT